MGMNKMFKKVLAVVAAGAMTMGMAMPTFAADEGKNTDAQRMDFITDCCIDYKCRWHDISQKNENELLDKQEELYLKCVSEKYDSSFFNQ